jgi:hypothetical protein
VKKRIDALADKHLLDHDYLRLPALEHDYLRLPVLDGRVACRIAPATSVATVALTMMTSPLLNQFDGVTVAVPAAVPTRLLLPKSLVSLQCGLMQTKAWNQSKRWLLMNAARCVNDFVHTETRDVSAVVLPLPRLEFIFANTASERVVVSLCAVFTLSIAEK